MKLNPGWKLFFHSKIYWKFHPGVKMYRFHLDWKMHVNKKYFTPKQNLTPVWNNACKLPLKYMKNYFIINSINILKIYCFQVNVDFEKDTARSTVC